MSLILRLVLLFGFLNWISFGTREVYNIAHMTNTPAAVEWAVRQGANGVEADLTFDSATGQPIKFFHGSPCDCSCMCPGRTIRCSLFFPNSVCVPLQESTSACHAESPVHELLSTLARHSQLAVIVIDSKVSNGNMDERKMGIAGRAVVDAIVTRLFNNGYGGQVVIGSSYQDTLPYLRSAVGAANNTPYRNRFYYALDMLSVGESLRALHELPTRNFVYGTGLTACSPTSLNPTTLQLAAMNTAKGTIGLTYIWSVDRESTMRDNLPYVGAIMSNYPGIVRNVIQQSGLRLATQSSSIQSATSSDVITSVPSCECHYRSGGCIIAQPAPEGVACHCTYPFIWTCSETIAQCKAPGSFHCQHPDTSVQSCQQGGGDCGGY